MSIGAAIVGWARGLRAAELVGWAAVAAMSALALTQIVGWGGGRLTAMAQSLTPFVLVAALPLSIAAFVTQRWALGAASAVVAAYVAVLAWPLVSPPSQPAADAAATPVQVFEANLLRTNKRSAAVAATLAHVDADVLVLLEYTFAHASAMRASALADRYPYRIERATRWPRRRHGDLEPLSARGPRDHERLLRDRDGDGAERAAVRRVRRAPAEPAVGRGTVAGGASRRRRRRPTTPISAGR